jgi:hypothetical protein
MARKILHRLGSKLQVYQQVHALNLATDNLILNCQGLEALNIVPRRFLTHCTNIFEEARALLNGRIMEAMRPVEARDAQNFQKERLKWEARPYPRIRKPQHRARATK